MKNQLSILLAFLFCTVAQAQDYVLTIDGKDYEIDLGANSTIQLPNGQSVDVSLARKAIVNFRTENFTFAHPSQLSPSRTDLGDGIHQTMMASPTGTMVMIQEYDGLNPTFMVDLMMSELLKEEKDYGYNITESATTQTINGGTELKGKKAVSKYRSDEYVREVVSYGVRDGGLLIITQIEQNTSQEDFNLLDTFWKTLSISME